MILCVVGQGYVGLPIAVAAANSGITTLGFDINEELVSTLNSGISQIEDVPNKVLERLVSNGKYRATSDPVEIGQADVIVICVPTPLDDVRKPDLTFIENASILIGRNIGKDAVIINESTSYPGTLRNLIKPLIEKENKTSKSLLFAVSPERVDPGNLKWNISNTPRLLSGLTEEATRKAEDFYSNFCNEVIIVNSPEIAETAKLFENTYRQVNIALVNELALISNKLNIPVNEVLDAASTKPYGFTRFSPGLGVGGHCIPVDPSYLAFAAEEKGIRAQFIELSNQVNLNMPWEICNRIKSELEGSLIGKTVLVCGLSYKSNVSDLRESPSVEFIKLLKSQGASVAWYDPLVDSWQGERSISLVGARFDACVIATYHTKMDISLVKESAKYILDCTGKVPSVSQL